MLIAHSMGSIVAYDVLRNLGQAGLFVSSAPIRDHRLAPWHAPCKG